MYTRLQAERVKLYRRNIANISILNETTIIHLMETAKPAIEKEEHVWLLQNTTTAAWLDPVVRRYEFGVKKRQYYMCDDTQDEFETQERNFKKYISKISRITGPQKF